MQLYLNDKEATLVADVLQMWAEGIEAEVASLAEQTDDEAHWSKFQLRQQFEMAHRIKLRIQLERNPL